LNARGPLATLPEWPLHYKRKQHCNTRASEGHQEWSGHIVEAAQRPRIFLPRVARKIFWPIRTYEETALVASRYIEGHALTLGNYTVTV